jgi:hypothetical protein
MSSPQKIGLQPAQRRRVLRFSLWPALLLLVFGTTDWRAAAQAPADSSSMRQLRSDDQFVGDNIESAMRQRRIENYIKQKKKEMEEQSARLVQLATELHSELAAAANSPLSAQQLRKINEIEKLAHSVKEKMSNPIPLPPAFQPEVLPRFP